MTPGLTTGALMRRGGAVALLLTTIAALLVAAPAQAQDAPGIDRVSGADRVLTAIAISQEAFADGAQIAVVARADRYADALAGGPLAAAVGGPVLLVGGAGDLDAVTAELDRLGVSEVYVLGGEAAVSAQVEAALAEDRDVTRLGGADLFATAQAIVRELDLRADVDTAVVVKGRDDEATQGFADAMSASWWAAGQGYAIVPVTSDAVPAGHLELIDEVGITTAYVVGGTAAVSEAVEAALGESGAGLDIVARLAGADRYETSALVWSQAVAQGAGPTQRWAARGDVFADALAAGPAVSAQGASFVLVHPTSLIRSPATASVLAGTPELLDRVVILGGPSAVSSDVEAAIVAAQSDDALSADAAEYCLTVLHSNDGESQLVASAGGAQYGGVARFASVVDRERDLATTGFDGDGCAEREVVLLNSGDNYLAGLEFQASQSTGFSPFYDAEALRAIDVDAYAIGNHEFDFGPDVLARFIGELPDDTPFVSVNLVTAGTALDGLVQPSALITKGSRQIGVIGATTPNLAQISSPGDVGVLDTAATVAAVNAEAADLRTRGADVVVLQAHLQDIDADLDLIARTTDVDVAIAGGGDEVLGTYGTLYLPAEAQTPLPVLLGSQAAPLPGTYPVGATNADGELVPIVTTPGDYEYVGRLRTRFDADGPSQVPVDVRRSRLVRVVAEEVGPDGVAADPDVQSDVVDPVAAFLADAATQQVATSEVPLDGRRSQVRTRQTNVGSLLTDSYIARVAANGAAAGVDVSLPTVALANGGGIRNDSVIEAGPVTLADTFDIAPFDNTVVVHGGVTAGQLKPLLERGVAALPSEAGQFAQVGGLQVEVDTSRAAQVVDATGAITTPGARVRSVTLSQTGTRLVSDGVVVDDTTTFNLATANFTADGGDTYPFAAVGLPPEDYVQVAPSYQASLLALLESLGTVTAADYPTDGGGRIVVDGG